MNEWTDRASSFLLPTRSALNHLAACRNDNAANSFGLNSLSLLPSLSQELTALLVEARLLFLPWRRIGYLLRNSKVRSSTVLMSGAYIKLTRRTKRAARPISELQKLVATACLANRRCGAGGRRAQVSILFPMQIIILGNCSFKIPNALPALHRLSSLQCNFLH
jgi:hypothetical protein